MLWPNTDHFVYNAIVEQRQNEGCKMNGSDQLLRITSWNVAGKDPLKGADLDYLFDDSKRAVNLRPDIQIVGLQEAPQYLFTDPWTSNLSSTLQKRGYILFKRNRLSGILLYIFVLKEILLRARDFETQSVKTGFGGLLGNKGGVSVRFNSNGKSFSIINSHLAAHQEKMKQRIDDYKSIMDGTRFRIDCKTSSILKHDYAFWLGDLNFRLDNIGRKEFLRTVKRARRSRSDIDRREIISSLHKNDQLTSVRKRGKAFVEFNETLPEFLPTFKFHIGSKDLYNSGKRIPAWTDRILFRSNQDGNFAPNIEQLFYDSIGETELSDHKPVTSMFRVTTFDPKIHSPSPIPYEVIRFEPITGWKTGEDGRLWYKISNELFYQRPKVLSSWDRLALYKADFASLEDYLTIVFVDNIARIAADSGAKRVPSTPSSPHNHKRCDARSNNSGFAGTMKAINSETRNSSSSSLPEHAIIGDGFKHFRMSFPDFVLMVPGSNTHKGHKMSTDQLIRITSWNVAGKDPLNGTMLDYLFDDSRRTVNLRPEIQIVGLQEAPQYLFSDPWTSNLSSTLHRRGYILFKRHKLSGILLYIFVLREIMLRARDFETESVKTGFGGLLGNKGGVSLRFTLNGNSFSVTNSHLAAHQEYKQQRIDDYNSIMDGTRFRIDQNTSTILKHDYSFWLGDLNFRLDNIEKGDVMNVITNARTSGSDTDRRKIISSLYKNDQLNSVREQGRAFFQFNETLPGFLPTYKFHIGSKDSYDSEKRIPAWTDRILFRYNHDGNSLTTANVAPNIEQLFYDSIGETELSDHKPVTSMFRVTTFDPKIHSPSPIPYEVIRFEPITGWKTGEDGRLWYKISNELFYQRPKVLSSWDRLALYKADFASLEDYLTIVFVNNIARLAPNLDAQQIAYVSSTPSSRASSPNGSRRGSVSSTGSAISVATEAITLNETAINVTSPSPVQPAISTSQVSHDDMIIGDGYKYFSATFSDDVLMIPGRYLILYLKTNAANEYNVYGISEPFNVTLS